MKKVLGLVLIFGACLARGQDAESAGAIPDTGTADNMLTSLAGQFFSGDFVNYNLFFNGIYDSRNVTLQNGGNSGGSGGFSVGGAIALSHSFGRGSLLSLNYRGEYRNYTSGFMGDGTNQYLSLMYSKRLGPRWTISTTATGGIIFYDSPYYSSFRPGGGGVLTNPFSPTSRFISAGLFATYQQTRRLSYVVGGTFILNRYSYAGSTGTTGGIFTGSVVYRLSARTTVGGTFSHNKFYYQNNFGDSLLDGGYLNVSHVFGRGWEVYASGGITRAHSKGVIRQPIQIIIPGGQTITGYVVGPYDVTRIIPTVQGGVRHRFGRLSVGANVGHGVNPGNGTYLTSSHTYFGGSVSRSFGRQAVIGGDANYSRIESIANQVSRPYSQAFMNASYSRVLMPRLAGHVTYTYTKYGSLYGYNGLADNRITVGIAYTSKSIPLTLF